MKPSKDVPKRPDLLDIVALSGCAAMFALWIYSLVQHVMSG